MYLLQCAYRAFEEAGVGKIKCVALFSKLFAACFCLFLALYTQWHICPASEPAAVLLCMFVRMQDSRQQMQHTVSYSAVAH